MFTCVSLNSRLESNTKEESRPVEVATAFLGSRERQEQREEERGLRLVAVDDLQRFRGGLVFKAHRLLYHSA